MSVVIKPKRTDVLGRVPSTEDLEVGEIAMNIAPGSEGLFVKNSSGEIHEFMRYTKIKDTTDISIGH